LLICDRSAAVAFLAPTTGPDAPVTFLRRAAAIAPALDVDSTTAEVLRPLNQTR
jgi:hypothetical protein